MPVVRYIALAALVVWLGVLQGVLVDGRTAHVRTFDYVCGGVLLVSLFAIKFLGPPPRAFVTRVAIVAAMIALTFADRWSGSALTPPIVNTALGFVLLSWYARE